MQPPNFGNFPSQQPFVPPPQPAPKKRDRRRLWTVIAIISGVALLACIGCGILSTVLPKTQASTSSTAPSQAQATQPPASATTTTRPAPVPPTALPTQGQQKTTAPTPPAPSAGPATLGGPVGAFIAKYGAPDSSCASCAAGVYAFRRYQGTELDYIEVMMTDGSGPSNGHVNSFLVQAPPTSTWDTTTATSICESFGPSDANYSHATKVITSSDGSSTQKVYTSAWLATQLSGSDFVDSNLNTVPAGTFTITYTYVNPNQVASCSVEAGIPAS